MQDISLMFNRPASFLLGYGAILACLLFPVLQLLRLRATSGTVKAIVVCRQGWRYLTVVLLGAGLLVWVSLETHAGFWGLHILDAERAALDYWYPCADRLVSPRDIQTLHLITTRYDFKGEVVHQRWTIRLRTREGKEYTSVNILAADKAQEAVAVLERWSGRAHTPYVRQGRFGRLQRSIP